MPGIRLHHPTLRNATLAIEVARGYFTPFDCPTCKRTHLFKTVHLRLDGNGDVIVSHVAWERDLRDTPNMPLEYVNTVGQPPGLILNFNSAAEEETVHHLPFEGRR